MKTLAVVLAVAASAVAGESLRAADVATDYGPGSLVVVEVLQKTVGRIVKRAPNGWWVVNANGPTGKPIEMTLPASRLSPAKPGQTFGMMLDRDGETDVNDFKSGALVVIDFFGDRVGRIVEEKHGSFAVQFVTTHGKETKLMFSSRHMRLAKATEPYGLEIKTGELLAEGKPSKKSQADAAARLAKAQPRVPAAGPARAQPAVAPQRPAGPKVAGVQKMPAGNRPAAAAPDAPRDDKTYLYDAARTPAAETEIARLLGTWRAVKSTLNGREVPAAEMFKFVFTPDKLWVSQTSAAQYGIDPTKSPKQLDFGVVADGARLWGERAIYELEGDSLRICWLGSKRPPAFDSPEARKGQLIEFRRAPDISQSAVKTAAEVDPTILAAIDGWIALIEAKNLQKFVDTAFHFPKDRIPGPGLIRAENIPPEKIAALSATLRAIKRIVPEMKGGGNTAEFLLIDWHIPDGGGAQTMTLVKVDGVWKISDQ